MGRMKIAQRAQIALMNKCPVSVAASQVAPGERMALVNLALQQATPLTIREAGAWMDDAEFTVMVQTGNRNPGLIRFEF